MHLTSSNCDGFQKCCISSAVNDTDDDMLWNGNEEDGNVAVILRKMKALAVKTEAVTDW
jgi:hypothetical protein